MRAGRPIVAPPRWPTTQVLLARGALALALEPQRIARATDVASLIRSERSAAIAAIADALDRFGIEHADLARAGSQWMVAAMPRASSRELALPLATLRAAERALGGPMQFARARWVSIPCAARNAPAAVACRALARAWIARIRGFEAETIADVEIEGVHQLRVGVRRLRCVLTVATRVESSRVWDRVSRRAQLLGRCASALRDVDVVAELVRELAGIPDSERATFETHVAARRRAAHRRVVTVLSSRAHGLWLSGVVEAIDRMPVVRGGASLGDAVDEAVARGLKRLNRSMHDDLTQPDGYHEVRRQARRVRDVVDVFSEACGKRARRWRKRLQPMQSRLGELNDADVALAMLATDGIRAPLLGKILRERRDSIRSSLATPLAMLAVDLRDDR